MKKTFIKYPLWILVILAVILRLPHLNGSFWMDEAAQALEVVRPLSQQLDIISDFQPPLLHFILHFAHYFSQSEWFLRTIGALIPGIVTIIFTYKIGELVFNKKVAFIATLLLTTSSFHIFFSQELRPYSLPTALAIASMYYFIQTVTKKTLFQFFTKNSNDSILLVTLLNIFGLYASYLYPFFMMSQMFYALTIRKLKETKQLFISFAFSIIAFIPFLPIFFLQLAEGGNVREQLPGWDKVVSLTQLKAIPLVFGKLVFGMLPLDMNPLILVLAGLLGISSLLCIQNLYKNYKKLNLKLLIIWILVPLFSAWIISFIVPVIQPKRLLFLLPGIYLLCAHGADTLFKNNKKIAQLFLATLFTINIVGILGYYLQPQLHRENWISLQQQLHTEFVTSETLLVYSFPDEFAPMRWYERNQEETFPVFATKSLYIETVPDLANDIKIAVNYKTVLVFDYLRDLTDPNRKIEVHLSELGFKEVGVIDYPNIGFVRIFMQPQTVIGYK